MSLALAHCKPEDVNTTVSGRDTRTPLHLAAALGNLPITQLLIWVTITSLLLFTWLTFQIHISCFSATVT